MYGPVTEKETPCRAREGSAIHGAGLAGAGRGRGARDRGASAAPGHRARAASPSLGHGAPLELLPHRPGTLGPSDMHACVAWRMLQPPGNPSSVARFL